MRFTEVPRSVGDYLLEGISAYTKRGELLTARDRGWPGEARRIYLYRLLLGRRLAIAVPIKA